MYRRRTYCVVILSYFNVHVVSVNIFMMAGDWMNWAPGAYRRIQRTAGPLLVPPPPSAPPTSQPAHPNQTSTAAWYHHYFTACHLLFHQLLPDITIISLPAIYYFTNCYLISPLFHCLPFIISPTAIVSLKNESIELILRFWAPKPHNYPTMTLTSFAILKFLQPISTSWGFLRLICHYVIGLSCNDTGARPIIRNSELKKLLWVLI
jgi:hypothetical protein